MPRFCGDYLGNLTELFSNYTQENITLFNTTCWAKSDKLDEACLLVIARTHDLDEGIKVHENTIKEFELYERLRKFQYNLCIFTTDI